MNFIKLTHEKLCIDAISSLVADDSCGAISLFAGTTRDNFEKKKVYSLEYEAYEPMATKQMQTICKAVREQWTDVVNIAVYHRLGLVPVREASVVIAISSPHRKSSLEAVAFAIEELKKQVPIWKKEKYEGDESSWKENKESSRYQNCKRPKLDLNKCTVVESTVISNNLVQIAANENEIRRRIQCFVAKKREEIDLNTLMDFTPVNRLQKELGGIIDLKESTCARTCNVIVKQEDSKCHLRVSRVKNRMGPQIRPDYLQTLDKLMSTNNTQGMHIKQESSDVYQEILDLQHNQQHSSGLHKRLSDVELHLNIKVLNTKHVYDRIKAIETRLLHLESISPEYKYFLADNFLQLCNSPGFLKTEKLGIPQKKTFSVDKLDSIIEQMKQNDTDEEKPCHINEIVTQ